jgi:hypothetical protein
MARRRWAPGRARLHFGDAAPPRPIWTADGSSKLKRTIADVVWTAVREDALKLTLADGRMLLIGGQITAYGDDYADPWSYNDIVVTHPDGAIEVLTYPLDAFPHLSWLAATGVVHEHVYIFGLIDGERYTGRPREIAILRLDTSTYEIAPVTAPAPRAGVDAGSGTLDGDRVVFAVARARKDDPQLAIAFDLGTLTWGDPFRAADGR